MEWWTNQSAFYNLQNIQKQRALLLLPAQSGRIAWRKSGTQDKHMTCHVIQPAANEGHFIRHASHYPVIGQLKVFCNAMNNAIFTHVLPARDFNHEWSEWSGGMCEVFWFLKFEDM